MAELARSAPAVEELGGRGGLRGDDLGDRGRAAALALLAPNRNAAAPSPLSRSSAEPGRPVTDIGEDRQAAEVVAAARIAPIALRAAPAMSTAKPWWPRSNAAWIAVALVLSK